MTGLRVLEVLGSSGGGVVRHVRSLCAGLAAAGDDVVVAGPGETLRGAAADPRAGAPYRVEEVPISDRPRPLRDLRAVLALRRLAADRELVHAHGLRAGALTVIGARSRRHRPRVVVTLHNLPVGSGVIAAISAVLERIVARGADVVLGVSPDLVDRARRLGARHADLAVVPAPPGPRTTAGAGTDVPTDRAGVRAELGVPEGDALVVAAARLAPQKGLDQLADALAVLRDRRPDEAAGPGGEPGGIPGAPRRVTAVVAGDGPLRRQLEDDARTRGLPLRLIGDRDDVPRLFAAADAVVLTSLWEGQSLAVQEALRAGAVLVLTDVGGNRAVTGDAAVLVPRTDRETSARDFAAALARVLDDPDFAADLRRRALERAARLPTEGDAVRQVRALGGRGDTPG